VRFRIKRRRVVLPHWLQRPPWAFLRGFGEGKVVSKMLLLSLSLAILSSHGTATDNQQAVPLPVSDLRKGLAGLHGVISSIAVTYRSDEYDHRYFTPGTFFYVTFAAKSPNLYLQKVAHGTSTLRWEDDLSAQYTSVQSNYWLTYNPVNRIYTDGKLAADDPLPGSLPYEPFLLATGICVTTGRSLPEKSGYPLSGVEISKSKDLHVRQTLEDCEGHLCHVLEIPGKEIVWVDVKHGFAIVRRELYRDTSNGPIRRLEMTDHVEAVPGVWLPRCIRNIAYLTLKEADKTNQITSDAKLRVESIEVNSVSLKEFTFDLPPGSLHISGTSGLQAVPGGLDLFEGLIGWTRRNAPAHAVSEERMSDHWILGILLATAIAIVVVDLCFLLRQARLRRELKNRLLN